MHASPNDAPVTRAACADPGSDAGPDGDPGRELAFRRSLRASRARRATATLRRRRTLRGRRSLLGAAAGLVVLSAGAFASGGGESSTSGLSKQTIKSAQRALGVEADGAMGPQTRRATRSFQRKNELEVDGVLGPQTLRALGVAVRKRSVQPAQPGASATLERIAQCESGGDPTAISADGLYRGKYQFSRKTWRTVGGKGDPAVAPEDEQDLRAARLLRRSGTTPWPNCA